MISFLDIECYPNLFFIGVKTDKGREIRIQSPYRRDHREKLRKIMNGTVVTFNGHNYDLPMIAAYLAKYTQQQLHALSKEIITSNQPTWMILKDRGLENVTPKQHIDLIRHVPMQLGLKTYAARIGTPVLRNLPHDPDKELKRREKHEVMDYCMNDIDLTSELYDYLLPVITTKQKESRRLGFDASNLTDSSIGEKVFRTSLERVMPNTFEDTGFEPPAWAIFENTSFRRTMFDMAMQDYELNPTGAIKLPETLNDHKPKVQDLELKVGIGGLHSKEKAVTIRGEDTNLMLVDAASYYPNLILTLGIEPEGFHGSMLKLYQKTIESRLQAKQKGEKNRNDILKIVINSAYGKLLNKYSVLYSPFDGIRVTLSGQLGMMLLAELLDDAGATVHSVNTDGILTSHAKKKKLQSALAEWTHRTGIGLDETKVKNAWLCNVNNYLLELDDGSFKGKGVFAPRSLNKTPQAEIVSEAVKLWLSQGISLEETIEDELDIRKFLHVRNVKGGGVWTKTNENLGKVVRWGWSKDGAEIIYAGNGNKVPKTEGAWPVMNLRTNPFNPNIDAYVNSAIDLIKTVGIDYESGSTL